MKNSLSQPRRVHQNPTEHSPLKTRNFSSQGGKRQSSRYIKEAGTRAPLGDASQSGQHRHFLVKRIAFVLATPTIDIQPQRCHLWLLQSRVKSSSEGFCWVQQQRWPWEPSSPIWLFSETTDVGKSVNSLVHGFKCPLTRWCCTENVWAHRTRAQRITTDVHRNPHKVKKKTELLLGNTEFYLSALGCWERQTPSLLKLSSGGLWRSTGTLPWTPQFAYVPSRAVVTKNKTSRWGINSVSVWISVVIITQKLQHIQRTISPEIRAFFL